MQRYPNQAIQELHNQLLHVENIINHMPESNVIMYLNRVMARLFFIETGLTNINNNNNNSKTVHSFIRIIDSTFNLTIFIEDLINNIFEVNRDHLTFEEINPTQNIDIAINEIRYYGSSFEFPYYQDISNHIFDTINELYRIYQMIYR